MSSYVLATFINPDKILANVYFLTSFSEYYSTSILVRIRREFSTVATKTTIMLLKSFGTAGALMYIERNYLPDIAPFFSEVSNVAGLPKVQYNYYHYIIIFFDCRVLGLWWLLMLLWEGL